MGNDWVRLNEHSSCNHSIRYKALVSTPESGGAKDNSKPFRGSWGSRLVWGVEG